MLLVAEIMPATSDSVPLIGKLLANKDFLASKVHWLCTKARIKANHQLYNGWLQLN